MYAHDVLFEESEEEFVAVTGRFLADAVEAGEPAVIVCPPRRAERIAEAIGFPSGLLQLSHEDVYRPPARALTALTELMESAGGKSARRVRLVTDVAAGSSPWQQTEWIRFEAVLDRVLTPYPLWSICVYDTAALPGEVLRAGERVHPMLHNGTGREPNRAYRDPVEVLRSTVGTPTDPLERRTPPALEVVDPGDLHALRRDLGTALGPAQLPGTRRNDLVAAASEIVINALVHGRAPVGVRLWTTPGRALIAVRDAGDGFDDAFAGYLPPGTGHEGGMGLWLARQLCDHVDTVRQEGGFVVRLTSLA